MRLLIVRHGAAVDPHEAGTDAARWLTPEGREGMRVQGRRLAELGLRPTRLFTSPLVRAVQTAEILAHATGFSGSPAVRPSLAPETGTTAQAVGGLDELAADEVVLLVGHMPRVRVMASHVLGGAGAPNFRTGAACSIAWDGAGPGSFEFLLEVSGRRVERLVDLGP